MAFMRAVRYVGRATMAENSVGRFYLPTRLGIAWADKTVPTLPGWSVVIFRTELIRINKKNQAHQISGSAIRMH